MNDKDETTKSETPTNETWLNGEPLSKAVEDAYATQFITSYNPKTGERIDRPVTVGAPIRTREAILADLRARLAVRSSIRQAALTRLGRETEPAETEEDYLAFGILTDDIRTRRYGGGDLGAVARFGFEAGSTPLTYRQQARALEVEAERIEAMLASAPKGSAHFGARPADLLRQAAEARSRAADLERTLAAEAESRALQTARVEAKAKAARLAEYKRLKALEAEFSGVGQ